MAMSVARDILGSAPAEPLRVLYWNGEDPGDEIERRVAAACLHYGIRPEDLGDRLFIASGRDTPITIATEDKSGLRLSDLAIAALRRAIHQNAIDVVILDPFVACHAVSENDNNKINAVCRQLAMIADETGCAIELVHHTRKSSAGQSEHTADDARGASAIIAAARSVRVLNRMTRDEAAKAGIVGQQSRRP
jgi:RecA-family ATPase